MTSYSFSFDRTVWSGEFSTRQTAIDAAIHHAREVDTPPESVFVGQRITPNDRAYGHAGEIIRTIRRRVSEDNGDLADGYLRNVSPKTIGELDSAIEATVRLWFDRNKLAPSWTRIEAVSEHPVPAIAHV